MKKIVFGLVLFCSLSASAQVSDTSALRTYINSYIVPNGARNITAQQLNYIFNGIINLLAKGGDTVNGNEIIRDTLFTLNDAVIDNVTIGRGGGADPSCIAFGEGSLANHHAVIAGLSGFGEETAIGASTLENDTAGTRNVAIGFSTMYENTSGARNVAIGAGALYANEKGVENVALGDQALGSITGNGSIAIGSRALLNTISGGNIAIGSGAGYNFYSGSQNTLIGPSFAGGNLSNGWYNTLIGGAFNGEFANTSFSNTVIISDGAGNVAFYASSSGDILLGYGANPIDAGYKLDVNGPTRINNILTLGGQLRNYSWATESRPSNPQGGDMGFNTTLSSMEYWNGTTWKQF